jgi:dihydrofolate reductase
MRKLTVFNFVTLNGYFKGAHEDISWHKNDDPEKNKYAEAAISTNNTLLFGRVTYEMMKSFWPTPDAMKFMPVMAEGMNKAKKFVCSNTLKKADWNNTTILKDDIFQQVEQMKQEEGNDMTILGSGSIITQFAEKGLIDEYQFMIDPVAIGDGTPIFKNMKHTLELELIGSKIFNSGVVVLTYKPL